MAMRFQCRLQLCSQFPVSEQYVKGEGAGWSAVRIPTGSTLLRLLTNEHSNLQHLPKPTHVMAWGMAVRGAKQICCEPKGSVLWPGPQGTSWNSRSREFRYSAANRISSVAAQCAARDQHSLQ